MTQSYDPAFCAKGCHYGFHQVPTTREGGTKMSLWLELGLLCWVQVVIPGHQKLSGDTLRKKTITPSHYPPPPGPNPWCSGFALDYTQCGLEERISSG